MFGLIEQDLKNIQSKIDNQSNYLDTNFFTTDSGQIKTLRDVSFSANHSIRYYAQLSNKIDTISKHALSDGMDSYFLTMTLDGFYRDLHRGDYRRFNAFSEQKQKDILKYVPDGEVYGEVRQKMEAKKVLSVKDLYNILNYQTKRFFKSGAFQRLKKANKKYMYIRTVEPHKDGIPHFHMMLFIPKEFEDIFKKYFMKCYPAPRNAKVKSDLSKREQLKFPNLNDDDMISFQANIKDSAAYIMKYILKSFMDVKNQKEIDYIQAWYIKHRITRCVTSQTLIPQWIYQKVAMFENDWFHLSDMKLDKFHHCEWSHEDNYFHFIDNWSGREILYQYGLLQVLWNDRILKEYGTVKEKKLKSNIYDKTPTTWTKKDKPIPTFLNDVLIGHYFKGKNTFFKDNISPDFKSDYQLLNYYQSLDIETVNLQHYGYVKNCCIDRGLIQDKKSNLNEYISFDFKKEIKGLLKQCFVSLMLKTSA